MSGYSLAKYEGYYSLCSKFGVGTTILPLPLHIYTPYSTNVHNSAYYNRVNSSCFLMILTYFKSTVARRCSIKKLFKNFPKFTGKHICRSLFLIKLQGSGQQLYLKRDSDTDVFPVNFTRFSRAFAAKLWKSLKEMWTFTRNSLKPENLTMLQLDH